MPQIDTPEMAFNLSLLGITCRFLYLVGHVKMMYQSCFRVLGCIKDDVIGEAELAEYLLYILNQGSGKEYVQVGFFSATRSTTNFSIIIIVLSNM